MPHKGGTRAECLGFWSWDKRCLGTWAQGECSGEDQVFAGTTGAIRYPLGTILASSGAGGVCGQYRSLPKKRRKYVIEGLLGFRLLEVQGPGGVV